MKQIKKVVLPVDFSGRSKGAVHYLELFAAQFQPEIRLVHVLTPLHYEAMTLEVNGPALTDLMAGREADAKKRLADFLSGELRPFQVTRELLHGEPAQEIVDYAHRESADLIAMPTHGYGPFRRFILGSVTAKVLHDADCPVLTGVHLDQGPPPEKMRVSRIVAALDMEQGSEKVLDWAACAAEAFKANLTVVHVASSIDGAGESFDPQWRETVANPVRRDLQEMLDRLGVAADILVDWGEPAKQVAEVAAAQSSDLLVIGRSHSKGSLGRLRTQSYAIIRMAACPVVSV